MKRKIKVIDKVNNKVVEGEVVVRNEDHFQTQLKYRARTYRDKTKYTRKQKHRSRDNDYHYAVLVQKQNATLPMLTSRSVTDIWFQLIVLTEGDECLCVYVIVYLVEGYLV